VRERLGGCHANGEGTLQLSTRRNMVLDAPTPENVDAKAGPTTCGSRLCGHSGPASVPQHFLGQMLRSLLSATKETGKRNRGSGCSDVVYSIVRATAGLCSYGSDVAKDHVHRVCAAQEREEGPAIADFLAASRSGRERRDHLGGG